MSRFATIGPVRVQAVRLGREFRDRYCKKGTLKFHFVVLRLAVFFNSVRGIISSSQINFTQINFQAEVLPISSSNC